MQTVTAAVIGTVIGTALLAGAARADLGELVDRLPAQANAVVAVDVAPVRAAVRAGGEGPRSPVPLPPVVNLQSVVLAAHLQTGTMEPAWEVAVLRVTGKASMPALASASRGYSDTVAGKPAAWCANDVFCVSLDERTIGAVIPADRQFAARWAAMPDGAAAARGGHDYLRAAAAQVKEGTPLAIAVDLKDAVSEAAVRHAFQSGRPQWAVELKADNATAGRMLAGLRGVTVTIGSIGAQGAEGTMTIDFSQDAAPLAPVAKNMVVGTLSEHGLGVPELASWQFTAEGNAVSGKGHLSLDGIERLVSFLCTPGVSAPAEGAEAQTAGATRAANPGGGDATAASPAEGSKRYFKAVSHVLDTFRPGTSLADSSAWLTRAGRQIDQLPSDGVDPDLILWGTDVSSKLREAAGVFAVGQQRIRARTSGVQTTAAYAAGSVADAQRAAQARADQVNVRRQVQQAGADERAASVEEANKALEAAMESRGKIRAAMVERYGGGF
jgi:hypothetical protein